MQIDPGVVSRANKSQNLESTYMRAAKLIVDLLLLDSGFGIGLKILPFLSTVDAALRIRKRQSNL